MTKKLLIVDDEPHIRLLLEQTLEDLFPKLLGRFGQYPIFLIKK